MKVRRIIAATAVAGLGVMAWKILRSGVRPVRRAEPELTKVLIKHAGRIDYADAWSTVIYDGEIDDPIEWAHSLLSLKPWVINLLRIRNALVRPLGLETKPEGIISYTFFPMLDQDDHEVVLGFDDTHLNFRVGITTKNQRAVMTTTVTINNTLGRIYWAVIRWFHPLIVASGLRNAQIR